HCVDKMFKKLKKRHERYIDKQNTARRAHALTDPKTKKLLMTAGSYDYTADGLNKLEADLRALQYKKISFNTEMLDEGEVPDDLKFEFQSANGAIGVCSDYEVSNAFAGIVMPAAESEEEDEGEEESDKGMSIDEAYKFCMFAAGKDFRGDLNPSNFNRLALIAQIEVISDRIGNVKNLNNRLLPRYGYKANRKITSELRLYLEGPVTLPVVNGVANYPDDYFYPDSMHTP